MEDDNDMGFAVFFDQSFSATEKFPSVLRFVETAHINPTESSLIVCRVLRYFLFGDFLPLACSFSPPENICEVLINVFN